MSETEFRAIDYWKLADALTVEHAVLLATGTNPVEGAQNLEQIEGFTPLFAALKGAILANKLSAALTYRTTLDTYGFQFKRNKYFSLTQAYGLRCCEVHSFQIRRVQCACVKSPTGALQLSTSQT